MSHARRLAALAVATCLLALLPGAAQAKSKQQLLVSLGDSYATGWQVTPAGKRNTTNSFSHQLVPLAAKRGYRLKQVNFGCGGATTDSMLEQTKPCPKALRAVGGRSWGGRTQTAAAERVLRRNRGKVALVTVSIGGNDVTACGRPGADPITCVGLAAAKLQENVTAIAKRLRAAAGPKVRIVGITYPDVILGQYVGEGANPQLAQLSVAAFQSIINPTLEKAYEGVEGRFVDVTAATGAYTPLTETTTLAPYGTIPVAVAKVCELTYFCSDRDIHMKTKGYAIIADLIAKTLPRRT